jgi:hypothetical protein
MLHMSSKQNRVMAGLLTAVGAAGAFFGARALMGWMRRRSEQQEYTLRVQQGKAVGELSNPAMPSGASMSRMPVEAVTATGRTEVGENYQSQFQGEREQATIPSTGIGAPVADQPRSTETNQIETSWAGASPVETDQPVPVGSLVGPLVVHLLSFHNMIDRLKQRRETTSAAMDAKSNTPDLREGGADAVSSLAAQLPEIDRSALVPGSLQERMFRTMDHIRDTLQNMDYNEEQLFHMHDEMRPAVCKVLELIHKAGQDNVTGFEDVQKAYNCM